MRQWHIPEMLPNLGENGGPIGCFTAESSSLHVFLHACTIILVASVVYGRSCCVTRHVNACDTVRWNLGSLLLGL